MVSSNFSFEDIHDFYVVISSFRVGDLSLGPSYEKGEGSVFVRTSLVYTYCLDLTTEIRENSK